jgi:hypothetical protein
MEWWRIIKPRTSSYFLPGISELVSGPFISLSHADMSQKIGSLWQQGTGQKECIALPSYLAADGAEEHS